MNDTITRLGPSDVASARELIRIFGEAFENAVSRQFPIPRDGYLRSMLENSRFIVLVAKHDERVVGGLTAHILDKFDQERGEVYLYDLAVQVQHRRKGVATNLINHLRQIAGVLGMNTMFVQADIRDDGAVNLYEHFGTKRDVFHFDISL